MYKLHKTEVMGDALKFDQNNINVDLLIKINIII